MMCGVCACDIKLSLIMTFIAAESRNLELKYTLDVLSQKSKRLSRTKMTEMKEVASVSVFLASNGAAVPAPELLRSSKPVLSSVHLVLDPWLTATALLAGEGGSEGHRTLRHLHFGRQEIVRRYVRRLWPGDLVWPTSSQL